MFLATAAKSTLWSKFGNYLPVRFHRSVVSSSVFKISSKMGDAKREVHDECVSSSVAVGEKKINYVRSGIGSHAVLCLPGALGSAQTDFEPQIKGLDPQTFTVIAWDPPGYGHSRPPERDFSCGFLKRDADYAVGLMKALNLPQFSVLGWSDGGITGIFLAANYPSHVRKMAIWGANCYITDDEAEMYKKIKDVSTWSERMRAPMVAMYGEDVFRKLWAEWVDAFLKIHKDDDGNICILEVEKIKCPLLVLHGSLDPMVPTEHPDYIVKKVAGSRLHTFPEGKHNIHLRYAKEFNSLIHKFLTESGPDGGHSRL